MIDFSASAEVVAPQLLGAVLSHNGVSVRLTEVEAYLGERDAASHTFSGRTPRNAAMFGPPGISTSMPPTASTATATLSAPQKELVRDACCARAR